MLEPKAGFEIQVCQNLYSLLKNFLFRILKHSFFENQVNLKPYLRSPILINSRINSQFAKKGLTKDDLMDDLKQVVLKQTFDVIKNKNLSFEQLFFLNELIKTDKWKNTDIMVFNKAERNQNKTVLLNSFDSTNILGGV